MVMVKWTDIYIVLSYSETLILNRFNRGSRLDESTEKSNERLLPYQSCAIFYNLYFQFYF